MLLCASATVLHATDPKSQESACPEGKVRSCGAYSMIGGQFLILEPTREELAESPAWTPFSEDEPPISVGEAIRIATNEFTRYFPDHEDWSLAGISLDLLCGGRWVWLLRWQPKRKGDVGTVLLPVLMSGAVIPLDRLAPIGEEP